VTDVQLTHGHKVQDADARIQNTFFGGCHVLGGIVVMFVAAGTFLLILNRDEPLPLQLAAGLLCAFIGYCPGFRWYAKGSGMLAPRRETTVTGSARMGTKEDLEQSGLIGKGAANDQNIWCGNHDGEDVFYSGERHVGIVGPSGYGKDTGYIFRNMRHLNRPIIVIDAKGGEIACVTAKERAKRGPVVVINPYGTRTISHPHLKSHGFNLLAGIDAEDDDFFSDLSDIAEAAVPGRGKDQGKDDAFFDDNARALILVCGMSVKWDEKKGILGHEATIIDICKMLMLPHTSPDENADTLQKRCMRLTAHDDETVSLLAGSFIAENKTNHSIITTAVTALRNLNDRRVAADLKMTPVINDKRFPAIHGKRFDFGMLRDHVITVYVILPENKIVKQAVWLRLMVATAINAIRKDVPGTQRPVLLINEAGWLGKLGSLEASMGMGRGKFQVMTVWQNLDQIRQAYGEKGLSNFVGGWGFSAYFACRDPFTAEHVSKRSGNRTVYLRSFDAASRLASRGQGDAPSKISLRLEDDLERMPPRKAITWVEPFVRPLEVDVPCYDTRWGDPNPFYVKRRA
jgi:type IV secretory pathway TraG/TraD family ATPase VirD4